MEEEKKENDCAEKRLFRGEQEKDADVKGGKERLRKGLHTN